MTDLTNKEVKEEVIEDSYEVENLEDNLKNEEEKNYQEFLRGKSPFNTSRNTRCPIGSKGPTAHPQMSHWEQGATRKWDHYLPPPT